MWALLVAVLASALAPAIGTAVPAASGYTLIGYVNQPGGVSAPPVPAGVQVDLVQRSSGTVFTSTVTGKGGQFTFSTSSTSSALSPGYWELYVPTMTNVSLAGCRQCAVLPVDQNPAYLYYNTTELTNSSYATVISNVVILPYNATLNGTVMQGLPVAGASVRLLAPNFNGIVLANATTNSTGNFSINAPEGTWILQSTHISGSNTYTNSTLLTIASQRPPRVTPVLRGFSIAGHVNVSLGGGIYAPVSTAGNATLFDPTTGYVYSDSTPVGGYYSLTPYLKNFQTGSNTFEVILATSGYGTTWYTQAVSSSAPVSRNVTVKAVSPGALGSYQTTLNLQKIHPSLGNGTLTVTTTASLGNNSVFPALPNATVGQLWAQLGLDFNHSLTFPSTDFAKVRSWVSSAGPVFPAVQAATAINGTTFTGTDAGQAITTWTPPAGTSFGLTSAGALAYSWETNYTLNGTIPKNASQYTLSFVFQHPTSAQTFNYTVELPSGYQLAAGTTAPSHTSLVASGAGGAWTNFTLVSKPASSSSATARFTIVRYTNLTANVNVSSTNFTFSSASILNSTHNNYTVVAGVGEGLVFSALNSTYPTGTNGTLFAWVFGDGGSDNTSSGTTAHTYTRSSGAGNFSGTLTVTTSGGLKNSTRFYVYVVTSAPVAKIASNATANESKLTTARVPYLLVKWGTTLQFNSTATTIAKPNRLSIASFTLTAKSFKSTANFTVESGGNVSSNWTVQFNGAGLYLSHGNVAGISEPIPEGWQYNLNLTVWSVTGSSSTTTLVVLVNDTQKPAPAFQILNSAGKVVSGSGVVVGPNGKAPIRLNAANSSDPNNGSIARFYWHINDTANSSINIYHNTSTRTPYPLFNLTAQPHAYSVNLTVFDLNGNSATTTQSLTVSYNSTTTPVLQVTNLTAPTTFTSGKSYTIWANVTVGVGMKSTALNLTVAFYYLSSAGTGSRTYVGGSPSSVQFYTYLSNGVVNTTALAGGLIPSLAYNKTVRAVITWTPSTTGNYILYANATCSNQWTPFVGSSNVQSQSIAVHPNPTTQLLEYVGIGAAVVLVIGGLIWWFRRPRKAASTKTPSGKSGLERGARRPADEDDDDEP